MLWKESEKEIEHGRKNYPKLKWRDSLGPEEQAFVKKLDATKQKEN